MQNLVWFQPQAEAVIKDGLLRAKKLARDESNDDLDLAISYLEGDQLNDVRNQITLRYQATQVGGGAGQCIEALTVPLVQRYVNEAASAYSHSVERKLVDESGNVNDEETKKLNEHLELIDFNGTMHSAERVLCLTGRIGLWWQAKRGALRPVVTYPQYIYPMAAADEPFSDAGDQSDYAGQIISMCSEVDDTSKASGSRYACVTPAQVSYYTANDPYTPQSIPLIVNNPFKWSQILDTPDQRGTKPQELALQMVTLLSGHKPVGRLMSNQDADLAQLNREINIQLSVLMDTMRVQGWSSMIINTLNPNAAPAIRSYGSRFALQLEAGETASYINASNPYSQLIDVLQKVIALSAIAHNQSPNDYSLTGATVISGFAKLVDSLPKIEARNKHTQMLQRAEASLFWPRMCSILTYLGVLSPVSQRLRLVTKFADLKYPLAQQEQVAKYQFELDNGLVTTAQILAEQIGISVEDAEKRIAENIAKKQVTQQTQPATQEQPNNGLLGQLIRRKNKMPVNE